VQREFQTLLQAFAIAGVKPPEFPELGAIEHKPQRVLELDEQRSLLLATPPERRLNIMAYLQLGLRLSEPAKITEVDWSARYVHVAGTKTRGSVRDVPIPDELYEHMLPRRGCADVIPHWEKRCADFVLRRTSLRAIGEAVSVNDLRGTYATHMARAGVPILTLAKIMGNSVAMLEQVYAQVGKRGDHLQQAASKLPRLTQPKPIAREA
jgi:integrase